ncbi:CGNR zinc finger domain-containing protein [Streptomyces tuirus]|uniref:CGNR zinc finger domain-containing protein n=1 Tax=Streptomyces tuirus TaxID=68278 RepID=A0A941J5D7_9ACTN|nr:CGNR zinc finger domain-containing protein [Streptomyces tuirus]
MREPISRDSRLALDLALTIRHDGHGGVADDLTDAVGLTRWVRAHHDLLPPAAGGRADHRAPGQRADHEDSAVVVRRADRGDAAAGATQPADGDGRGVGFVADAAQLTAVRELRAAVRALFARAVRPGEPSPADAARLMPVPEAVRRLNEAAARTPTVPVLDWPEGAGPVLRQQPAHGSADLTAALAHAAIAFLASPDRDRLRACHAPRCVRYFLKEHPRQEWCKPSCGNRARVARHHERHKATT